MTPVRVLREAVLAKGLFGPSSNAAIWQNLVCRLAELGCACPAAPIPTVIGLPERSYMRCAPACGFLLKDMRGTWRLRRGGGGRILLAGTGRDPPPDPAVRRERPSIRSSPGQCLRFSPRSGTRLARTDPF